MASGSGSIYTKLPSLEPFGNNEKEVVFHSQFSVDNDTSNGIYVPEEILLSIFKYLNYEDILSCSLVCKRWCNVAKSNVLWQTIYNQVEYPKKAKNLPWYVFYCYFTSKEYFTNVIKNGNGLNNYEHWAVVLNNGEAASSCFVMCDCDQRIQNFAKYQKIDLSRNKLLKYIIKKYRPTLYASEQYAARYNCAFVYKLVLICETKRKKFKLEQEADEYILTDDDYMYLDCYSSNMYEEYLMPYSKSQKAKMEQWQGKSWQQLGLLTYLTNLYSIL